MIMQVFVPCKQMQKEGDSSLPGANGLPNVLRCVSRPGHPWKSAWPLLTTIGQVIEAERDCVLPIYVQKRKHAGELGGLY